MRKILLILILASVVTGCTVPVNVYVRNLTNKPAEITIQLFEASDIHEYLWESTIENPKFDSFKNFSEKLAAHSLEDSLRVLITIPAKSTLYLEKTMNFRSIKYKMIEIGLGRNLLNTDFLYINPDNSSKKGLSQYCIWYDITN